MRDKEIIKRMFKYPLKSKFLYVLSLFLFSCQDFSFLAYLAFVQYYAVSIIENNRMNEIIKVAAMAIGLYGAIMVVACIGALLIEYVGISNHNRLKYEIVEHILNRKAKDIDTGDINSRLLNDTSSVAYFATSNIGMMLMPIVSLIGSSIIIFMLNVKMGLIVIATMILPIIYNMLVLPKIKEISSRIVLLNSEYLKKVGREFKAFSTIKLFNLIDKEIDYTKGTRKEVKNNQINKNLFSNIRVLISNISNLIATLIVMVIAVKLYNSNDMTLAQILIIPQLLGGMISGIDGICSFSLNMQQPIASAKRIFEIIDEEMVEDITKTLNKNICDIENLVEVKDLSFGYDENNMIINSLNFNIKKGQIACFLGHIGCGKSTVIKMLLGFLNEKSGDIKVFNKSKTMVNQKEWFSNFAFVEQEPSLFNLSIEENILLGNNNEDKDSEKMNEVLKVTGLGEMLQDLPDGLKTKVGTRGTSLSGGQRQLVSVARALYSNAPIVILDEFSSAMDSEVEKKLLDAIQFYKKEKTFIMISHRKSCLEISDEVIEFAK